MLEVGGWRLEVEKMEEFGEFGIEVAGSCSFILFAVSV